MTKPVLLPTLTHLVRSEKQSEPSEHQTTHDTNGLDRLESGRIHLWNPAARALSALVYHGSQSALTP
ncbi:MAG TPA: hypothetical protein VMH04_00035, partial [Candidatus Solibacter sp.]|nr:hypothetical protein [Candidatus Solibacter sp.]